MKKPKKTLTTKRHKENWSSRIGVILAVAGSAIGIGNFLRFPGQVAEFGGGAFMLAYFIAFVVLGLPLCWAEWTVGRYAGSLGFHSIPGIVTAITKRPFGKYIGTLCLVIPTIVFMYFVCVQSWCLGYASNFLFGKIHFSNANEAGLFFANFTGLERIGGSFSFSWNKALPFLIIAFTVNFVLIYRGVAKGIEWFCKFAMPVLLILALVVLARVLTLGTPNPEIPEASISNGLGFMWNPQKTFLEVKGESTQGMKWIRQEEIVGKTALAKAQSMINDQGPEKFRLTTLTVFDQLKRPKLWLAASGQIFFSLAVGFGIIATYASYLTRKDDIVLSALTATSANEFTEVSLGGLITIPAAVAFFGVSGIAGNTSLFSLGFNALPLVFSSMPAGNLFGFLFFFLLFLGSVSACLSMLQPGIAFLEEALGFGRKRSVTALSALMLIGTALVAYYSLNLKALDTLDFWAGTFLIFVMSTIFIILFGWVLGIDKAFDEAHQGSALNLPKVYKPVLKYLCPTFLLTIFICWLAMDVFGLGTDTLDHHIADLMGQESRTETMIVFASISMILLVTTAFIIIAGRAPIYKKHSQYHANTEQ